MHEPALQPLNTPIRPWLQKNQNTQKLMSNVLLLACVFYLFSLLLLFVYLHCWL